MCTFLFFLFQKIFYRIVKIFWKILLLYYTIYSAQSKRKSNVKFLIQKYFIFRLLCKEKLQLLQTTKSTVYLYKLLLKSNPVHDIFFKNRFTFFFFFFNAITIIIPKHYYVEDLGLDPCFFFFFKSKSPFCHVVFRITVVINKSVLTWPFDSGRGENVLRVLNGSTGQHTHARARIYHIRPTWKP